ncbi:unnamed protein product [Owenia fusiformis]|uniref:Uncharacterized protein n=1 Tax=Owenia fusiformis TaxID=6347 RepID=A0A8J1XY14_OWEFU|nr:unnamed protein product [Owenia fusiformis]
MVSKMTILRHRWIILGLLVFSRGSSGFDNCGKKDSNNWVTNRGNSYKVFSDKKNLSEAENTCLRHNGHLTSVTDAEEFHFLQCITNEAKKIPVLLGITKNASVEVEKWTWIGNPDNILNNTVLEPFWTIYKSHQEGDCVEMTVNGQGFHMAKTKCGERIQFICKVTPMIRMEDNGSISSPGDLLDVMDNMPEIKAGNISNSDLTKIGSILIGYVDIMKEFKNVSKEQMVKFATTTLEIVSDLFDPGNAMAWSNNDDLSESTNLVANLVKTVDDTGSLLALKVDEALEIDTAEIIMKVKKVKPDSKRQRRDVEFVNKRNESISLPNEVFDARYGEIGVVNFEARDIGDILGVNEEGASVGSVVKGMSVFDGAGNAIVVNTTEPIVIIFSHSRPLGKEEEPVCGFLVYDDKGKSSWSSSGCRAHSSSVSSTTCHCNHLTSFAILMQTSDVKMSKMDDTALSIITYVGCAVSLLSLLLTVALYFIFRLYRSDRAFILLNLAAALIVSQTVFIVGADATHNKVACFVVAILLHYSFLACFFWMLNQGLFLYIKLRTRSAASRLRMSHFSATGWFPPAIIVGISVAVRHESYISDVHCWLSDRFYLRLSFIIPALAVVLVNCVVLGFVIKTFLSVKRNAEKNLVDKVRAGIRTSVVLLPVMGMTWVFGALAIQEGTVAFQYIFAILNTLQGFFIFLFHCMFNEEVRGALVKSFGIQKKKKRSQGSGGVLLHIISLIATHHDDGVLLHIMMIESIVTHDDDGVLLHIMMMESIATHHDDGVLLHIMMMESIATHRDDGVLLHFMMMEYCYTS